MRFGQFVEQLPCRPRDPLPCVQPVRISTIFCEPMRHGTHFPQDSLRKKRTAFSAMSSMQRPSAQTTMAPDPSMDPTAASDLKSRRTSTIDAGRYPDDGPEGAKAFSCLPSTMPPACSKITSDIGSAHRESRRRPGLRTSPLTPTNFSPPRRSCPAPCTSRRRCTRICGTLANVSTLLIAVGLFHRPS